MVELAITTSLPLPIIRKDAKKKLKIKSGYSRIKLITSDRRQSEFIRFELSDLNEQVADLQEDLQPIFNNF
uniref:COMM domain-containing protein n=1 Tax=Caenorhabditis tropicalis TaxID=1561998 RepID=A0A1I7U0N4_9PELO